LPAFRDELRAAGLLDAPAEAGIAAEVRGLVDDATDFAETAADPDPATLLPHVYAEPEASGVSCGPQAGGPG
jgi:TPP-dependent pyruvate/acetoin dehydrogenase alpha subunit